MAQKLHAHVDAYQDLTEKLIKDCNIKGDAGSGATFDELNGLACSVDVRLRQL